MADARSNHCHRGRLTFSLVLIAIALAGCGASGNADHSASEPTSSADCAQSLHVLVDLKALSNSSETTLDSASSQQLDATLADLRGLMSFSADRQTISLSGSVETALAGLGALARSDPHGASASTRQQATSFGQRYLSSSQALYSAITQRCK